jgi:hypothetical protein
MGGSSVIGGAILLMILGGALLFIGSNSARQHKNSASNLADQIQQIQSKQLQLQAELDTMPNR